MPSGTRRASSPGPMLSRHLQYQGHFLPRAATCLLAPGLPTQLHRDAQYANSHKPIRHSNAAAENLSASMKRPERRSGLACLAQVNGRMFVRFN